MVNYTFSAGIYVFAIDWKHEVLSKNFTDCYFRCLRVLAVPLIFFPRSFLQEFSPFLHLNTARCPCLAYFGAIGVDPPPTPGVSGSLSFF